MSTTCDYCGRSKDSDNIAYYRFKHYCFDCIDVVKQLQEDNTYTCTFCYRKQPRDNVITKREMSFCDTTCFSAYATKIKDAMNEYQKKINELTTQITKLSSSRYFYEKEHKDLQEKCKLIEVIIPVNKFIKTKRVSRTETDDKLCSICYETFENSEEVEDEQLEDGQFPILLKCGHYIHEECLYEYENRTEMKCYCKYICKQNRSQLTNLDVLNN
jgi:hypothetical protein